MSIEIKGKTCCFSGHRTVSIHDDKISAELFKAIYSKINEGYSTFIVGGALGFDMLAAIILSGLKRKGTDLKIIYALPCYGYTSKWKETDRALQSVLLQSADAVVMVSTSYTRGCMQKRNRYMVEHSDACICYMLQDRGGTAYTVNYARKQGLEIINIYK